MAIPSKLAISPRSWSGELRFDVTIRALGYKDIYRFHSVGMFASFDYMAARHFDQS